MKKCENCKFCSRLIQWDYRNLRSKGVLKKELDGFACTAFNIKSEDYTIINMIGVDKEAESCEMYIEREVK